MTKLDAFLVVVAVAFGVASAMTESEKNALEEKIAPIISTCAKDFAITKDDFIAFKKTGDADALDSCFYACVFKNTGILTDGGLFDFDKATKDNNAFFSAAEDKDKIEELHKKCSHVNKETLANDTKGCARSKLLVACYLKELAV